MGDTTIGAVLGPQLHYLTLSAANGSSSRRADTNSDTNSDTNAGSKTDPADDLLRRLHEIGDIGNSTLEQITDAVPTSQQLHRMLDLHVRREHQKG